MLYQKIIYVNSSFFYSVRAGILFTLQCFNTGI